MAIRSMLAVALGSMAVTLTTDTARSQEDSAAAVCNGLIAHITLDDYDGAHAMQLCVAPNGFSITGNVVSLHVYDNMADGLFHNAFEPLP
jgi:uncharacterized membrane protein